VLLEHPDQRDVRVELPHRAPHRECGGGIGDLQERLCGEALGTEGSELGAAISRVARAAGEQRNLVTRVAQSVTQQAEVRLDPAAAAKPVGEEQDAQRRG
jgi:hypothetical protein